MQRKTNRQKFVQVTLTDGEHEKLKKEAGDRRMSMSALLASSWIQMSKAKSLKVPMTKEQLDLLIVQASEAGLTPWEYLISLWYEKMDLLYERDSSMQGRHIKRQQSA